ncbi:MAG: hypothetical protein BroJett025_04610 [Patescibacteria group bacterium]|nr:MAG: hypothetical protein BroJett025_04610 [Patescibacteria group bacterium]
MKQSNKLFLVAAVLVAITFSYRFAFGNAITKTGGILGKNDTMEDSLDDLEAELDASFAELDKSMEFEIDNEIETLEVEQKVTVDDAKTATEKMQQVTPTTAASKKSTKIERLLLVIPVEIETNEENKTVLGRLLDLLSF